MGGDRSFRQPPDAMPLGTLFQARSNSAGSEDPVRADWTGSPFLKTCPKAGTRRTG